MFCSLRLVGAALAVLAAVGFCAGFGKLETTESSPAVDPAPQDHPIATPGAVWIRLLLLESVEEELALSDQQKERLRGIGPRITERAREAEQLNRLGKLTAEQRAASSNLAEQTRREMVEETLQPRQLHRLKQLAVQLFGVRLLQRSQMQRSLGLSAEQTAQIEELGREAAHRLHEIADAPSGTGGIDWEKARLVETEWEKALLAVLTPDQREQFDRMAGSKFAPGFPHLLQRQVGGPIGPE